MSSRCIRVHRALRPRRFMRQLAGLPLLMLTALAARAQQLTVTITPVTATVVREGGRTAQTTTFTVQNTSTTAGRVLFTVQCTGVQSCQPALRELYLPAGKSAPVRVVFNTPESAVSGTTTLVARDTAQTQLATASTTVLVTTSTAAVVTVPTFQAGPNSERSLCPTIAVVPGVASQCGALRVTHALPSVKTYMRDHVPVLAYYSDVYGSPSLTVNVSLPSATTIPDSVLLDTYAVWSPSSRSLAGRRAYAGSAWSTNRAQRVSSGPLGAAPTGIYTYDVEVLLCRNGSCSLAAPSVRGTLARVERTISHVGIGWWVLGVEELALNQAGGSVLWAGGDGSTREYTPRDTVANPRVYVAPSIYRPDTLYRYPAGNTWVRVLGNGVKVTFDSAGRHISTSERHGITTTFSYVNTVQNGVAVKGDLSQIAIQPGRVYDFTRNGTTGALTITTPDNRNIVVARTSNGDGTFTVNSITDPDGGIVRFQSAPWGPSAMVAYVSRRGDSTKFSWESYGRTLGQAVSVVSGKNAVPTFRTAASEGRSPGEAPRPVSDQQYFYDGPRNDAYDHKYFWTDTLGAVEKTYDPTNRSTLIEHGDARFPGLPTRARIARRPTRFVRRTMTVAVSSRVSRSIHMAMAETR
jgi:hypothetical protein